MLSAGSLSPPPVKQVLIGACSIAPKIGLYTFVRIFIIFSKIAGTTLLQLLSILCLMLSYKCSSMAYRVIQHMTYEVESSYLDQLTYAITVFSCHC